MQVKRSIIVAVAPQACRGNPCTGLAPQPNDLRSINRLTDRDITSETEIKK